MSDSINYINEILDFRYGDLSESEKQIIHNKVAARYSDEESQKKVEATVALFCEGNNPTVLDIVKSSSPSDVIDLDDAAIKKLMDLYDPKREMEGVPLDIMRAGTIPIRDMICQVEGILGWRVIACTPKETEMLFQSSLKMNPDESPATLAKVHGFLIIRPVEESPIEIIIPMVGNDETDMIRIGIPWCYRFQKSHKELMEVLPTDEQLSLLPMFIAVWYGIEIALLHPLLKASITTKPKLEPYSPATSPNHKKKAKVKYMKHYSINASAFDDLLSTLTKGDRKYTRHTLAWYVIGHYTTLRNGKRQFIQGYWKGPLRHMKAAANQGQIRGREIAQLSEEE